MMNDLVFVSYARADSSVLGPLIDALRAQDIQVWVDQSDIAASLPWRTEIELAIRRSVAVAIVASPAWHGSKNCLDEYRMATAYGKAIVWIDASTSPGAAVTAVQGALATVRDGDRATAVLLADSARWDRAGRPTTYLPRGKRLRDCRRAISNPVAANDAISRSYVAAGRQVQTIRRGGRLAVMVLTGTLLVSQGVLRSVAEKMDEITITALREQASLGSAARLMDTDPYRHGHEMVNSLAGEGAFYQLSTLSSINIWGLPTAIAAASDVPAGANRVQAGNLSAEYVARERAVLVRVRGALNRRLNFPEPVTAMSLDKSGENLAIAAGRHVLLVSTKSGATWQRLAGLANEPNLLWWSRTGRRVMAQDDAGRAYRWDLPKAQVLHDGDEWYMALAANGDRTQFGAVSRDGRFTLIEPTGETRTVRLPGKGIATAVAATQSGYAVARAGSGGAGQLVLVSAGGKSRLVRLPNCSTTALAADAAEVALSCGTHRVRVLNIVSAKWKTFEAGDYLDSVAIRDGQITAGLQTSGVNVGIETGHPKLASDYNVGCPGGSSMIRILPGGQHIVAAGPMAGHGCLTVLAQREGSWNRVNPYVLSPLGNIRGMSIADEHPLLVALGSTNGSIYFLDLITEGLRHVIPVTGDEIRGLEFLPGAAAMIVVTRGGKVLRVDTSDVLLSPEDRISQLRQRLDVGSRAGLG